MNKLFPMLLSGRALALGAGLLLAAPQAGAVTLSDLNSTFTATSSGASSWVVDGTDHLFRQWFWFRLGDNPEEVIDTLSLSSETATDANLNAGDDQYSLVFESDFLRITVDFALTGSNPGSGISVVNEDVTITNLTGQTLSISFFQFSDFDVDGISNDDTVRIVNGNKAVQSGAGSSVAETVSTPPPSLFQVDLQSTLFGLLNDGNSDDLSGAAGPVGPADVGWAFQWNFSLAPEQTFEISKVKRIAVPEPAGVLLLGGALVALAAARRRSARA